MRKGKTVGAGGGLRLKEGQGSPNTSQAQEGASKPRGCVLVSSCSIKDCAGRSALGSEPLPGLLQVGSRCCWIPVLGQLL